MTGRESWSARSPTRGHSTPDVIGGPCHVGGGIMELDASRSSSAVASSTTSLTGVAGGEGGPVPAVSVRTVAGLMGLRTGQVPRVGDSITVVSAPAVTDTDRLRVARVKVSSAQPQARRSPRVGSACSAGSAPQSLRSIKGGGATLEVTPPRQLAGVAGLEPGTYGFGDRRSTN